MKVFISQLMNGKTDEEIITERDRISDIIRKKYPNNEIEIIQSFIPRTKDICKSLVCLSHALRYLADADLAVFGKDWQKCRGCRIEHSCCVEYGIDTIYLDE